MKIDAFEVCHAPIRVLRDMGTTFSLATMIPKMSLATNDYDVVIASGPTCGTVTCKVPDGMTVKRFVEEFCFRFSYRYVYLECVMSGCVHAQSC